MSLTSDVSTILRAASAPMSARDIRAALGDTDTAEKIGGALFHLLTSSKVAVNRDVRPFTYIALPGLTAADTRAHERTTRATKARAKPAPKATRKGGNGAASAGRIVNVLDPKAAVDACASIVGEQVIVNAIRRAGAGSGSHQHPAPATPPAGLQPIIEGCTTAAGMREANGLHDAVASESVSIDRQHLRTLTRIAMRMGLLLNSNDRDAIFAAARILL